MREKSVEFKISSRVFWVKVIDHLQQNWAVIEPIEPDKCIVYFVNDDSGVFDQLPFCGVEQAERSLRSNGFQRFAELTSRPEFSDLESIMPPPQGPFFHGGHRNGKIYSSGLYWE